MAHIIKYTVTLLFVLLTLPGIPAYAQEEMISGQSLAGIYRSMKSGELALLEGKEIHIQSGKSGNTLKADVYAITPCNFADLYKALSTPQSWSEFVPLHVNVKSCIFTLGIQPIVTFYAGRKFYESPEEACELNYRFQTTDCGADGFRVELTAEKGPYGTSDYKILIEALLTGSETLIHMGLSYKTSLLSRTATLAYLSTIGKDKVGFSIVDGKADGPVYVKGVQGIIERNVMRYFLALSIYMDTLSLNSAEGFIRRAEAWYDLTEQYAIQLHELGKQEYLEAKQNEYMNQQRMQRQINLEFNDHGTDKQQELFSYDND